MKYRVYFCDGRSVVYKILQSWKAELMKLITEDKGAVKYGNITLERLNGQIDSIKLSEVERVEEAD